MANEKKTQTSTNKKKTASKKNSQVKAENKQTTTVSKSMKQDEKNTMKASSKKNSASKSGKSKNDKRVQEKAKSKNEEMNKKVKVLEQTSDETIKTSATKEIAAEKKSKKEKTAASKKGQREKTVNTSQMVSSDEMTKLVKIILVLAVIVVVFYGITVLITKMQKTSTPKRTGNDTPAVIQYDEILIGTMLNQSRDEYYVLIQKDDDQYLTLTSYYLNVYKYKQKALKVYIANINSVYNQLYIAENSNIKASNISDFRVSDVTLIKVKDHQIVEAYEGIEDVEAAFKALVK